ncbi:pyridine nucleotide-disulfide oxidoreductase [Pseudorhodoferax sp. Leaf274]|nr:pyridine nucleotide-disulfide oxidoreductase [Pseudorhodoferax sp. Leaf274]
MSSNGPLVIVGAGHAGAELALSARQQGWAGTITLVGEEVHLPYQRPPLSKAYLSGSADGAALELRSPEAFDKAGVTLKTGTRVLRIDRAARQLLLADGSHLAYAKLALCLGGRPRPLTAPGLVPGSTPPNLHCLRTRGDADGLRAQLAPGRRLVVVGGGYVGLEVAASARKLGASVVVVEGQPRVLARVTGPALSAFYEEVHRAAGVDLRTGVTVNRAECAPGSGAIEALVCSDGSVLHADLVLAGIGMLPNVELAAAAGLAVADGIVVDAFGCSSDPDIHAAGDCTNLPSALYGRRLRLESVPNALEQARAVAAALCGKPKAYDPVPWFWSDQYELKLQMVGLSHGEDQCVLRGAPGTRSFIAFYLRAGRVVAAEAVNRPQDFMVAKRLVAASAPALPQVLADESQPLKGLLAVPA